MRWLKELTTSRSMLTGSEVAAVEERVRSGPQEPLSEQVVWLGS
jgi:hypothetical protein